jgi:peptidoglycan glycosyltransferase
MENVIRYIKCGLITSLLGGSYCAQAITETSQLIEVPNHFPPVSDNGFIEISDKSGTKHRTTIIPEIQQDLDLFIKRGAEPIAAVVVLEVETGRILAISQGRDSKKWGENTHTALHTGFPAASLFKTVVSSAAIEIAGINEKKQIGLQGGCAKVRPSGVWMKDQVPRRLGRISLKTAYGQSCNGFYAKLAVNSIGLGIIKDYAQKYGWGQVIPADFIIPESPLMAPESKSASTHTVGRFAAGFGRVGASAVHVAWQYNAIANDGIAKPLVLLEKNILAAKNPMFYKKVIDQDTAERLRDMMKSTVRGGTANYAFKRRKFRSIRPYVGGKTGTLTGKNPQGLTTWFAGMMPLEEPEIVVAAVAILKDRWIFKGPNLAAEAFYSYSRYKRNQEKSKNLSKKIKASKKSKPVL